MAKKTVKEVKEEYNLKDALDILEREREISKEALFDAITNSLIIACKNHFKSADNVRVDIDKDTCEFHVIQTKEVIELADDVMDPAIEISLDDAKLVDPNAEVGGFVEVEIDSRELGRIATQNAKNVITQKIRDEEKNIVFNEFSDKKNKVVTGTIQRRVGRNWSVNLGKADGILTESEMIRIADVDPDTKRVIRVKYEEKYAPNTRMKFYVVNVESTPKGSKITVSRTHPNLVRRLFEEEVTEIKDGTVEIKSIAREPGSRTKMAVYSNNPDVDPIGACVGVNGARVNAIVDELRGEKIDVINWDENPGQLIKNALSPAQIVNVFADPDAKSANVVVPDEQLSLAIGKDGQNARLAAKLTNYKIDIKSETQAKDQFGFRIEDYMVDEDEYDEYEDDYVEDGESSEGSNEE